jgi:two-component system, OmpR family, response regulator
LLRRGVSRSEAGDTAQKRGILTLVSIQSLRIVVIEDDPASAAGIVRGLRRAGFEVEVATDGETGLTRASEPSVALVVLDLMLPERHGEEVLRKLRARGATPVIVVTAQTGLRTRLGVFELGAVDYLPKPFFVEELVARVQARLGTARGEHRYERFADVVIDLQARTVELSGEPLRLTPTELAVLAYLVERPGRAIARTELAAALPDLEERSARNLDAHVARLRKKLGNAATYINTVWGYGYRFDPAPSTEPA